jgi:3-methylcrotonyl-CoA carboxylase alpha subunit
VTELVTGLDLVEWQIRVAAGERLPLSQAEVPLRGHAIEARVYAEDPERDYLPQAGKLLHLAMPEQNAHVRVDSGVVSGDTVSVFYDPMIGKLAVWDHDRAAALRRLRRALEDFQVAGLTTNLALLSAVAQHPAFAEGDVHTGFLQQHAASLHTPVERVRELMILCCVGMLEQRKLSPAAHGDPYSPWADTSSFRINADGYDVLYVKHGERELEIPVHFTRTHLTLGLPDGEAQVTDAAFTNGVVSCRVVISVGSPRLLSQSPLSSARIQAAFIAQGGRAFAMAHGLTLELDGRRALAGVHEEGGEGGAVRAPMPGKLTAVLVQEGERVEKGQALLRLEAMKMEHTLRAAAAGVVEQLSARAGVQVDEGSTLLFLRGEEG